ncbi:twin-arginine translocase subunit TatC [Halorientalis brevis]|uniref:Sec-independent protein translocase protein TatC n=1 Tax=Halorientalis brevis TaxID=1126241 RepID=A0ABD6CAG0_9EURY|nr:twin-arginine translocase subunit TatC [Halorientalis brevis]
MSDGDSGPRPETDSEGPEPPDDDSHTRPDDAVEDHPETGPDVPPDEESASPQESEAVTPTEEHNQVTVPGEEPAEAAGAPTGEPTPAPGGAGPEPVDTPGVTGGEPGGPPGGAPASTPGAPDDEEMPLTAHIEEMVHRLGVVLVVMAIVAGIAFPFADRLINFLWFSLLPGVAQQCPPPTGTSPAASEAACPRVYHPLALMLARLKVATLAGFIVALPVFVAETYLFMRPGLFPRERKYYLAAVPTSVVLAGIGVAFAFLLVLPAIFTYFLYYSEDAAVIAFGLSETFNLMVMMLGMFAFIFQIPLFVMLAIMMGVTTRRWLETRRLYFWGGFLTIAFFFSPDPTGMAPIIVGLTMVILFEGTLGLLRWTGEGSMAPGAAEFETLRPLVWLLVAAAGYLVSPAPIPRGYYDQLPAVVVDATTALGLGDAIPVLIGGGLLVLFEGANYLLRRVDGPLAVRRLLAKVRVPVWLGSVVVGYLASPNPTLLRAADVSPLSTMESALLVVGLIVWYELLLLVAKRRGRRNR